MRRTSVILLTIAAVLMMPACVSNQAPTTAAPKVGKPLVKRLPAKIERVELVGGTVRAKAGYQFVKQANGSVTVARMGGGGGGPGLSGTWGCECVAAPSAGAAAATTCTVAIYNGTLNCVTTGCAGSCNLIVTIEGLRTPIIAY